MSPDEADLHMCLRPSGGESGHWSSKVGQYLIWFISVFATLFVCLFVALLVSLISSEIILIAFLMSCASGPCLVPLTRLETWRAWWLRAWRKEEPSHYWPLTHALFTHEFHSAHVKISTWEQHELFIGFAARISWSYLT